MLHSGGLRLICAFLEARALVSDPFHVPPFVRSSVFYGTRLPVDFAMDDVAVLQAGRSAIRVPPGHSNAMELSKKFLGCWGHAKAHVDAVIALIEKRVVLANHAMAVQQR
jgi:hypothetical protein